MIYYLDRPQFTSNYFVDAWLAFTKRDVSFFTLGFLDSNSVVESIINILHEGLNFSDTPNPVVPTLNNLNNTNSAFVWGSQQLKNRRLNSSSPRRKKHAVLYNLKNLRCSPILNGLGGGIEKVYNCTNCKFSKSTVESFVSLSFKPLSADEVSFIRKKFLDNEYLEGMVYREIAPKKSLMTSIFKKKESPRVPLLTIRDFLCHLNYTVSNEL